MSTVIKSYVAIFLVLLSLITLTGVVDATVQIQNARDYHSAVVNEIENSNHSDAVIEKCVNEASANGYNLIVTKYESGGDNSEITKVTLEYQYTILFLNVASDKQIIGYAR